jgi:hypothetical protein
VNYLEPDTKYGNKFLEVIKESIGVSVSPGADLNR